MDDSLLEYFNRELSYLRPIREEFVRTHPQIAERLSLSADTVEDPHVRRLIDAFAFLTARVQRKLEDDFPELTHGLLEALYPHYLAPIPSMAIMQMTPRSDLSGASRIEAGAEFMAGSTDGYPCRFRTAYPVELWPIAIEQATLTGRPFPAPPNPTAANAAAVIRLVLRCTGDGMRFDKLEPDRLRFFICGEAGIARPIYELIMAGTTSIAIATGKDDPRPVILPREHLHSVGFEPDECILPSEVRSSPAYRLLTEYFAFPDKFLFFDISGLKAKTLQRAGSHIEIYLYLTRSSPSLERVISADSFALGCTPVVNLFKQRAEPIKLNNHLPEYRVVPDARRQMSTEVYSVQRVMSSAPGSAALEYSPFYRPDHGGDRDIRRYWHMSRRPGSSADPGSEVYLSIVDLDLNPDEAQNRILSVDILSTNRDAAGALPFGGGQPKLQKVDASTEIERQVLLTKPTQTLRTVSDRKARWRQLSHLTLNHLSLADDAEPLREILRLYDFRDSNETRSLIDAILKVRQIPATARIRGTPAGVCRGIEIQLELADMLSASGEGFLLASVLDRFFGLYVTINGFTRITAQFPGRSSPLSCWPARAGSRALA